MDRLKADLLSRYESVQRSELQDAEPRPLSRYFPRVALLHLQVFAVMFLVVILGSHFMPMIDRETLRPDHTFPSWLKAVSYYSNIPIKLGVVHAFLYGCELVLDPSCAERHIGQRLTTMWVQLVQHHRWGQHLQMQVETCLQVVDIFERIRLRKTKRAYPEVIQGFLVGIGALMLFTNFITSCCYHTLEEQLLGMALTAAKLFAFDYFHVTQSLNRLIGSYYTNKQGLIGAVVMSGALVMALTSMVPVSKSMLMHPTVLATLVFAFCFVIEGLVSTPLSSSTSSKSS